MIYSYLFLAILGLWACDEEDDRFERVQKLRGLGVQTSPFITAPPTDSPINIDIILYGMLPLGTQVDSVSEFDDENSFYSLQGPITIDQGSQAYTDYSNLRIFSVNASMTLPVVPDTLLDAFNDVVRIRYGITLTSGSESENIIGDVTVVPLGDEALGWQAPTFNVLKPEENASLSAGEIELEAEISKGTDEEVKVVWFVTSGKVENPRDKKTTWKEMEPGQHTVIFAIYPRKTRAFDFVVRNVTIQ